MSSNQEFYKAGYVGAGAVVHISYSGYSNTFCTLESRSATGKRRIIGRTVAKSDTMPLNELRQAWAQLHATLIANGHEAELCKVCFINEVAA